jgi:hypothetical protein
MDNNPYCFSGHHLSSPPAMSSGRDFIEFINSAVADRTRNGQETSQ